MSIVLAKYRLNGITDQLGNKTIVKIFEPDAATIIATGYVINDLGSITVTHNATLTGAIDGNGNTCSELFQDESISIEVTFIPFGASKAATLINSYLPSGGFLLGMSYAPKIFVGTAFADATLGALNTHATAATSPQFVIRPGASIRGAATGDYLVTLTAVRYAGMPNPIAITS